MWEILAAILIIWVLTVGYKIYSKNKLENNPEVIAMLDEIQAFFNEIDVLIDDYFTKTLEEKIRKDYRDAFEFFGKIPYLMIKNERISAFKSVYSNLVSKVKGWNENYVEKTLLENEKFFDNIDGKSLDDQQRRAIVVDEINNLILAGAGSGKTLTISGKVKFLVDIKNIKPEEILLISFTNKAADEMSQRIAKKLHIDVEAKTFHKFGLGIITRAYGKRLDIAEEYFLSNLINQYFESNVNSDRKQIENLIHFFGYYLNIPKDWEEFSSLGDCYDHYKNIDFETLKGKMTNSESSVAGLSKTLKVNKQTLQGETVKSLEEVMIANFLFLNGIEYIYEYKYPYESPDPYRKAYRPDFYLPDYDIYVEHFGITKDNKTPWLSKIEEEKYLEGMKWKREFHQENKTTLLETYSYYNKEGRLLIELEKKLNAMHVEFKEVDYLEIYKQIFDQKKDKYFSEFKKLISSFISLFKSNGYGIESFGKLQQQASKIRNVFLMQRSLLFLKIVKPIFLQYQEELSKSEKIDFNDMINIATDLVREGKGDFKYKYIIIDEYQDISVSRFNLIKEVKNRTGAKLMCVGDDWQSIYRFAGSDIDLFTNFDKYFGYNELLRIEKTYRNSQELIDIAGKFIMKNPKQFVKELKSDKHHSNPLRIIGYNQDFVTALKKIIREIVYNFGEDAEVTILGRNNFDIDFIETEEGFRLVKSSNQILVKYNAYPNIKINFLTVHKAKGLEADNVIVINLENKLVGFPNKISDDPVLSLVLTDLDTFEYAEERRLFYVALTRTRNTIYLMVPDNKPSVFSQELIEKFNIKYEFLTQEHTLQSNPNCPKCQKGYLVIRENSADGSKKFLGCSNYPSCDYTLKDIEIMDNQIKCRVCGGYMTKRKGSYGEFYGCTNYPLCTSTFKIEKY